jgi:predicted nuclease with TOPRIM domain
MPTMVREAWTDQRLDDLKDHMDEGFRELRADVRSLKSEMGEVRGELGEIRGEIGELRGEVVGLRSEMNARFDALSRTLQIGFSLIGVVLAGILGLIGTQL